MTNKALKFFGGFYLIILVVLAILYITLSKWEEEDFWVLLGVLLLIFMIFLFVGLFIGMVLSLLFKKQAKEKLFYWMGQFVSLGVLVLLILYGVYKQDTPVSNAKAIERTIHELSADRKDTVRNVKQQ
jgi:hypothetical protein